MLFEFENFVSSPLLEVTNSIKKVNLLVLTQHYKLSINETMTKSQVRTSIVEHLKEEELLLDSSDTDKTA